MGQQGHDESEDMEEIFKYLDLVASRKGWDEVNLGLYKMSAQSSFETCRFERSPLMEHVITEVTDGLEIYRTVCQQMIEKKYASYDGAEKFRDTAEDKKTQFQKELEELTEKRDAKKTEFDELSEKVAVKANESYNISTRYQKLESEKKEIKLDLIRIKNAYEKEFLPKIKNKAIKARMSKIIEALAKCGGDDLLCHILPVALDTQDEQDLCSS